MGDSGKGQVGWNGLKTDYSGRLGELRAPTLVVHGDKDPGVPVAWARRAHERIPGSEPVVFGGCGHLTPRERPLEFDGAVARFLASRDGKWRQVRGHETNPAHPADDAEAPSCLPGTAFERPYGGLSRRFVATRRPRNRKLFGVRMGISLDTAVRGSTVLVATRRISAA